MCGKNWYLSSVNQSVTGSPPRVREKLKMDHKELVFLGITPACAGKTRTDERALRDLRDHPRVCGKNLNTQLVHLILRGSPPRVREKLVR